MGAVTSGSRSLLDHPFRLARLSGVAVLARTHNRARDQAQISLLAMILHYWRRELRIITADRQDSPGSCVPPPVSLNRQHCRLNDEPISVACRMRR